MEYQGHGLRDNHQLAQGEIASSVVVNLIASNNQNYDLAAERVRLAPESGFTQVIFRLPDNLAAGGQEFLQVTTKKRAAAALTKRPKIRVALFVCLQCANRKFRTVAKGEKIKLAYALEDTEYFKKAAY